MSLLSKRLLIFFGMLDAYLLFCFVHQIRVPFYVFDSTYPIWYIALEITRPVLLLSLAYSAWKLIHLQQSGLIASYIQFPFRFFSFYLSFGFLSKVSSLLWLFGSIQRVMILACVLEGVRLVVTIVIHINTRQRHGWVRPVEPVHDTTTDTTSIRGL